MKSAIRSTPLSICSMLVAKLRRILSSQPKPTPGTQANPLLDNYEGLAIGPRLPGGRRSLLLQSDDNFSAGQVTRVVALGVENGQLR